MKQQNQKHLSPLLCGARAHESCPPHLLLKASASHIPLRDGSVHLVIATPPHLGARPMSKGELCTNDPKEYARMLADFLAEAARVVRSEGHILLFGARREKGSGKSFEVLRMQKIVGKQPVAVRVRTEIIHAPYSSVKSFTWAALPVRLYDALIRRFSSPGETVLHVFSGSGNSAVAALALGRTPILVDLHYHRLVRKRLRALRFIRVRKTLPAAPSTQRIHKLQGSLFAGIFCLDIAGLRSYTALNSPFACRDHARKCSKGAAPALRKEISKCLGKGNLQRRASHQERRRVSHQERSKGK